MHIRLFASLGVIIWSGLVWAHPVSFKDSVGLMGYHSPVVIHNQINYSIQHWWGLGVHHVQSPQDKDLKATFLTSNLLLKRWNGSSYQGNLYALLGGGMSSIDKTSRGSGVAGLQFDIEDRKYYFLVKHLQVMNSEKSAFNNSLIRAGIAPYQGSFNDLHSWIILEWSRNEWGQGFGLEDTTPFLRFFYNNLLFEVGQSFRGLTKFNYIIHF